MRIPLSEVQFRRIEDIYKKIDDLIKERNIIIQTIIAASDYYDKELEVTGISAEGIDFTLMGGDHSSSSAVRGSPAAEQLTLKLEE